jgi:hypothetical protein
MKLCFPEFLQTNFGPVFGNRPRHSPISLYMAIVLFETEEGPSLNVFRVTDGTGYFRGLLSLQANIGDNTLNSPPPPTIHDHLLIETPSLNTLSDNLIRG